MKIGKLPMRAFVVTVQEYPERTTFIQNHFKSVGIDAENFNGVNANVSGLTTTHYYEIDNPGSCYSIGPKPVSSWVSFYMLWSALNLLPDRHFLTLEWDACFQPDWRVRAEKALMDVPEDFDILMLGVCCAKGKPTKHIAGEIFEVKYPCCGHASIIAKKAIPVILETQRKVYAPIDLSLIYHTFPMLKVYCIQPTLATQFDTILPP